MKAFGMKLVKSAEKTDSDIVVRLRNRAKNLDDEGLYVEAAMNLEASDEIAVLREIIKLRDEYVETLENNLVRLKNLD